jgi:hypothetical protein
MHSFHIMNAPAKQTAPECLRGLITDADLSEAEHEFPGICAFYASCVVKPHTFLELAWRFQCACEEAAARAAA